MSANLILIKYESISWQTPSRTNLDNETKQTQWGHQILTPGLYLMQGDSIRHGEMVACLCP